MAEITITREDTPNRGRYAARVAGQSEEAELTYRRSSPGQVVVDHTYSPDALRGTGIARALVERVIADARAEGFKIVPRCSYVKLQFDRHPEWSDVLER